MTCGICGGAPDLSITASERMFGWGGEFWYDRCGSCGCVQLREVPNDLERYYATDYYAFGHPARASGARRMYRRLRDMLQFGYAARLSELLSPLLPDRMSEVRNWLARTGAGRHSRILDVGCGSGHLLLRLANQGFERAEGVDPFVREDLVHRGRVLVRKATIHDVSESYDLIMLHHSLEHVADQYETMARVAHLLEPGGWCLVRVPTVSSFAWEEYRDRWVQLDAPRHLYLHSVASLEQLAARVGLRLVQVEFDSTAFQFEGSELYRRDRPLTELRRSVGGMWRRIRYARQARRLNAEGRGDQAAFYLQKP